MKHYGRALPRISEDVQETRLRRLTTAIRFTEACRRPRRAYDHDVLRQSPKSYLLAFVYGRLEALSTVGEN